MFARWHPDDYWTMFTQDETNQLPQAIFSPNDQNNLSGERFTSRVFPSNISCNGAEDPEFLVSNLMEKDEHK